MKRAVAYGMILILLILVVSCGGTTTPDTPKATVERLVELMKKGDFDGASKLLINSDLMMQIKESYNDPLSAVVYQKNFERGEFVLSEEVIEGDQATVKLEMNVLSEEGVTELHRLLTEAQAGLDQELSKEKQKEELARIAGKIKWTELKTMKQNLLYHLEKVDGLWKINGEKTEILQ